MRGDDAAALSRLEEYFEAGGACAEAYRALGEILLDRNETAGAEDAFERAARADAVFPGVHLGLAQLAASHGDGKRAASELAREIALDPDSPLAYLEMGLVHERLLGDAGGAAAWYARCKEHGGTDEMIAAQRTAGGAAAGRGGA